MSVRTQAAQQLWNELGWLFEDDDGSLPEIRVLTSEPAATARIFEELRRRSAPLGPSQTVWHNVRKQEVAVDTLGDAGALAVGGALGQLHIVARGIESGGIGLPDLGVSVDPDGIAIDYRMGERWNPAVLAAFVELLADLMALDAGATVDLEDFAAEARRRFREAVGAYLGEAQP